MSNRVSRTDVDDQEFVDAVELASDGYTTSYRTVGLVSTTAATRIVVISSPTDLDVLDNIDEPLQVGDIVNIYGNAAVGWYTVEEIIDLVTFRVIEVILDSAGGSADFYHPAGATRVGFDPRNTSSTSATNVQQAIEDLDTAISDGYVNVAAECVGQVFFSVDGSTFQPALPITSSQGWLVNDQGILIVGTCDDGYC
jgi:hypothetical protein